MPTVAEDTAKALVAAQAKDLNTDYPRSPREKLGGYVLAARMLDKCRAELNNTVGEYHFNCPMDRMFFDFTEIDAEALKSYVATGASDAEVATYIQQKAKARPRVEVITWNNELLGRRLCDAPPAIQEYMEDYVAENMPHLHRPIYFFFDIFDIEEKRI
jgi:hypothetical protein